MKNNKRFTVSKLSLALTAGVTAFSSAAQQQQVDEQMLVTANRTTQQQFTALSSAQIITSEQISRLQVENVAALLDTVAGINIASQGGGGQVQSIFTRGANANHTLILVDGVRVNSATLGYTNISTISPAQIERIEVVKGPRAALWGSDAIGGVIQIFSKQYAAGEGAINISAGSHSYQHADAAIGLGNETHQLTVSVAGEDSDGFNAYSSDPYPYDVNEPDDDGYDRLSASINGKSQLNQSFSVSLVGRIEEGGSEYDASYPESPCWDDPTSICPAFYANEQEHDNYSVKVGGEYVGDLLTTQLSYGKSQDQATTFGNGIKKSNGDEIKTERDQFSLISLWQVNPNASLTLGGDYYEEQVSTNTDKDPWTPGFQGWAIDKRDVAAVFVQTQIKQEQWLAEAAYRYDDIEHTGSENTYNVSLGYQINANTLVSATRSTGFKAPSFNDLYWPGSGNPDLKPEQVDSSEILLRHRFLFPYLQGQFEAVVFESDIEDLIAWAPNEFGLWQPENINNANIKGAEVSAILATNLFTHTVSFAYIETEDESTGIELLRRPEKTASYQIDFDWQQLMLTALVNYHDDSQDSAGELDSFVVVDIAASYQLTDALSVNAKFNNVFDEDYQTVMNYQADGSNYKVGLSYQF
ncbi:TonB-dependent receptor [Thalassotalea sp. Y01]|uniref:TonB-dependent receptor domain-containing protein n=1 Tax=Thalassotalea sp. Y01 TaxID=2729613 RepID=UPI00145F36DE|nr:TonB-dependent receptor [Thalassotalea sp. Y01]NMP17915.1 TonB-dependent receptor [Thalassotalea sp. Y01]